jgi:hypothetical protein
MRKTFWTEHRKGRGNFEDLGIDGRIILQWTVGKYYGKLWTGLIWSRIGTGGRLL